MKKKITLKPKNALVVLNTVLLVVLGIVTLGPSAKAQVGRSRGQYIMVGGKSVASVTNQPGVAYILDQSSQELICLTWNEEFKSLTGVGYRNISKDIEQGQRSR